MSQLFQDDGPPRRNGKGRTISQKVMLATTAYDSPDAAYTFAMARSREALATAGIPSAYLLLTGNCHVDDARNSIVAEFLAGDCTDLVFLDADVSWEPHNLVALCQHDADVVGGVYPYRRPDAYPGGEMPYRSLPGAQVGDDGLLEVIGLPTGFMRIRRRVLETLAASAETYKKKDGAGVVPIIFERTLESGTRWGGDLKFCMKWRDTGGVIYADYEMRLGHTGKVVIHDSLGSATRRREGSTLRHICDKIRAGKETMNDYMEARLFVDNHWGAYEDVLALGVLCARQANGPIIEAGSGLTTVLMAAATDQTVFCLEHHGLHAAKLRQMAAEAGVGNIGLCVCPIKDGWYDISGENDLPDHFALGLNDGPPRQLGDRMKFFDHVTADTIICDDADDPGYARQLDVWAAANEYVVKTLERRAALLTKAVALAAE